MTPAFFQNLHPLLPFTYGITAMRECIAGMYGSTYIHNLLILLLYVPISLLIGLGIRPLLSGLNRLFDQKLAETELMIGETPTEVVGKKLQLSMLLSASLSQEELQIQTASKAQAFEKNYQKMIKIGFLAILIVPLIFLILMFSLDSKLVCLVLWILSIILIATWLIIVEYLHSAFANQQKLAGMSFNEMLESFRKRRRIKIMKNIFQIFYHDIKKIRKNVIALIVILGITIVPSLYAWFNIAASWDPYGNTGDLKVAIASQDKGYDGELIPVKLNLGDQILSELHENTQLNWVFTNAKDAKKGVKSGRYYAALVIPKDFSQDMMSLFSPDVTHPKITYYINEKENAIAPKITDKGATAVQQQVNSTFTETISKTALEAFQYVADISKQSGDKNANR